MSFCFCWYINCQWGLLEQGTEYKFIGQGQPSPIFARIMFCMVCFECRPSRRNVYCSIDSGYHQRLPIYNWYINRSRRTSRIVSLWGRIITSIYTKRTIQYIGIWAEAHTQGAAQQRQSHEGIWHRRHCGSNEAGEVKQKGRGIPKISIQNKGDLWSSVVG